MRLTLAILLVGLATVTRVVAQFDLSWNTIDGGGATQVSGGIYELSGTIGQPDANNAMSAGIYTLSGGFWPGVSPTIPGDTDGDGDVDLGDLARLLAHFGTHSGAVWSDGDFDGDGDVDLSDLATLLSHFGQTAP